MIGIPHAAPGPFHLALWYRLQYWPRLQLEQNGLQTARRSILSPSFLWAAAEAEESARKRRCARRQYPQPRIL